MTTMVTVAVWQLQSAGLISTDSGVARSKIVVLPIRLRLGQALSLSNGAGCAFEVNKNPC